MTVPPHELGVRLFAGRTAEVYAWGEQEVIKLYQPWMSAAAISMERMNTMIAHEMGLPVPAVADNIMVAGRSGLILERLQGTSMMCILESDPTSVPILARKLAEMHMAIHAIPADTRLPNQRAMLHRRLSTCEFLSPTQRTAALAALTELPSGERLCHGDFHPGNIIIGESQNYIIDWIDACGGNPVADLARSAILFLGSIDSVPIDAEVRQLMLLFHQTYLDTYIKATNTDPAEYAQWLPIMATARLTEGIRELQPWLLAQVTAAGW